MSLIANVGSSLTLTAAASGSPAPTFQWRKDGSIIAGATSASYTITSVAATDIGSYTLVATNVLGSAVSDTAVISVNTAVTKASGGGAIETWFAGALLLLGMARWMARRR